MLEAGLADGCRSSASICAAWMMPRHWPSPATRDAYPDLAIPFHSRWRHFEVGGCDRWAGLAGRCGRRDARARAAFDLAIVSVLLDAGAGRTGAIAIRDRRAQPLRRPGGRELRMFADGAVFVGPHDPLRADARPRRTPTAERARLPGDDDNPLVGLDGRADLLRRLGDRWRLRRTVFAADARPGGLFDHLASARRRPDRGGARSSRRCSTISGRSGRRG